MSTFKKILIPVAIVAVAIVAAVVLTASRPVPVQVPPELAAQVVRVITARRSEHQYQLASQGTLMPVTQTTLVAEVSGKVVWVSPQFVAGGYFSADEPLLKIDPSDYEAQLKQAEATLASRQAVLAREQAQATQAELDWAKLDSRKGQAAPALVLRKPQLAEAQANVKAAEAELDRARRNLQRTVIAAPYAGLVRQRDTDLGQFLSPGSPVGVTFAVDRAEVRLPLSTDDLAFVDLPRAGQPIETGADTADPASANAVTVWLEASQAGQRVRRLARLARSEQVIDASNRVIYAVAELDDPYALKDGTTSQALPMGTFVSALINGRQAGSVIQLPREVVRDNNTVMVVAAENLLELRPVTVLRSDAAYTYIRDGLEDGERVITTPIDAPIPGTMLRIDGEPPAAETPAAASDDAEPAADGAMG